MSIREQIVAAASGLSEPHLGELLDFANFLRMQEERKEWRAAAQAQFAKAYGDNEPEYTEADLKGPDRS